ncbi:MAG: DUF2281 domain-containing protein [Cyanobacteriota bacterium]|nr:DUF2281 domain-containing protein [Cyanobacteriota bacterium]
MLHHPQYEEISSESLTIMTAVERLYQLIQALLENQINEVLNFAEFLNQKQLTALQSTAIPGTLTGLRGIAKRHGLDFSDDDLQADYTDYLTQKYQ